LLLNFAIKIAMAECPSLWKELGESTEIHFRCLPSRQKTSE